MSDQTPRVQRALAQYQAIREEHQATVDRFYAAVNRHEIFHACSDLRKPAAVSQATLRKIANIQALVLAADFETLELMAESSRLWLEDDSPTANEFTREAIDRESALLAGEALRQVLKA